MGPDMDPSSCRPDEPRSNWSQEESSAQRVLRFTQPDLIVLPGRRPCTCASHGRRPRHHPEARTSEPGPRSLQTSQAPRASECRRDPAKCPKGAVHVRPGAVRGIRGGVLACEAPWSGAWAPGRRIPGMSSCRGPVHARGAGERVRGLGRAVVWGRGRGGSGGQRGGRGNGLGEARREESVLEAGRQLVQHRPRGPGAQARA